MVCSSYFQFFSNKYQGSVVRGEGQGAGTRENRGGRLAGSERRRNGMRESCEGGRRMRDMKIFNDFLVTF